MKWRGCCCFSSAKICSCRDRSRFAGAANAVFSLSEAEAARGVVTHSSGNHGAALALAAQLRGIRSWVVMPRNAPKVKVRAVEAYGAEITFCEPTLEAREAAAAKLLQETGASLIHPYDDDRVIAGQGTAALEFLEEIPDLDMICTAVSGGGLLSGTAIAAKSLRPEIQVAGCEPANADDARRSLASGHIEPASPTVHDRGRIARDAFAAHVRDFAGARGPHLSGDGSGNPAFDAADHGALAMHGRAVGGGRGFSGAAPADFRGFRGHAHRDNSFGRESGCGRGGVEVSAEDAGVSDWMRGASRMNFG